MIKFDHPLHDEDPYNDGSPDTDDTDAECAECGYDILSPGRELCDQCFQDYHGPDKDFDPETIAAYTYDIQAIKDTQEGT